MKFLNQQPLESFENNRSIYIDTATNTLGVAGKIALFKNNDVASFKTNIQASNSLAADYTFTLPSTPGTNGQALVTDGAGNLSFVSISGVGGIGTGTVTSVTGTGSVSGISLSGTVTESGDLTLSGTLVVHPIDFAIQNPHKILAGPVDTTDARPTFRYLIADDIPALNYQAPISATGLLKSNGTSGNVSAAVSGTDYALPNQTMYLGTTAIALNRASATGLSLVGVSVDGSAGSVAAANLTGNTLASGVTGSSLTSVGTLNGVTVGGDIAITGTARRITGDFSNATITNRVAFQTSTTDGSTILTAYPNGAGTTTGLNLYNGTDPLNSNVAQLSITATETRIAATAVGTATNIPMTFYTGGSESLRIGSTAGTDKGAVGVGYNSLTNVGVSGLAVAGKVGIGTNAPSNILEVQETGTGTGNGGLTVSTATTGGNAGIRFKTASTENWQITTTGSSGSVALRFYDIVNSAERMRIDASGNVGIGTTSTSLNALNVVANASTNYAMFDAPTSGYAYTSLKYAGSFYGYFGQGNSIFTGGSATDFGIRSENSLVFGISTVEKMRLHSNGYVGIGNISPTGLLTLGSASGTNGNIVFNGSTSGSVTIKTAVAAGTWSLTLPTSGGTSGYVLQTDGSGVTSWVAQSVGSSGGTTTNALTIGTGLSGTSFNGSAAVTIAIDSTVALRADTHYIGTTSVALNRASANLALTGISSIALPGSTSGTTTLQATAIAGTTTITLPATTGTLVLQADVHYIGTTSVALNRASANLALTGITSVAFPGSTSGTATLQATAISGTPTLSLPTVTGTLIGSGDTGSVTNTMLANSSFYIGTTSVSLGRASANLALTGITSIDGSAVSAGKATNLVGGNNTTLLGSIPYQSNTDTTILLGPNTTTTKKFLRMTGNGTNGTPPAWDTIAAGDIPTLNQNTSGSAGSVANTLTIGTGLSGTSFNGSAAVTIAIDSTVALRADTTYIGTTSVALNRSSANLALAGITSITGGSSVSQSLTLQSTSGVGSSDSILFKVGNNGATTAMTINTSGNIGIGTASPGQKLTVAGTIESTSGGVKFPDGTTQTTAASGSGSSYYVGQVINSPTAPSTGTWLQTGKTYVKSSYSTLATALGSIADFGVPATVPTNNLPVRFVGPNGFGYACYCAATNGTVTIVVGSGFGVGGAIRQTLNTSGSVWTPISSQTSNTAGNNLNEIRYLNSTFIAVGNGMAIVTSTDGTNWTPAPSAAAAANYASSNYFSVAYGAGTYVAVGYYSPGTAIASYSTDGVNWTINTSIATYFNRVIYANSLFVAVGISGSCYTSPDGITWTSRSAGSSTFYDIIYANSLFVAIGAAGACYTSSDGITWTSRSAGSTQLNQVIYANSLFVVVGNSFVIYTSSDGITWTSRTNTVIGGLANNWQSVIWNGTNYVVSGGIGAYATSPTGTTWTSKWDTTCGSFYALSVTNGITTGHGNSASVILEGASRADVMQASSWGFTPYSNATSLNSRTIAYSGTTYVTVMTTGGAILYSSDAISWNAISPPSTQTAQTVWYLNGYFLITTASGAIFTSTDNVNWAQQTTTVSVFAMAYGNSKWVGVGNTGGITYASTITSWTTATGTGSSIFYDVIYANSLFVAVGAAGACYTSSDGVTWTTRSAGAAAFYRVIYANSLFVAVGATGTIYTSSDGATWTASTSSVSAILYDIAYGNGYFVAVGASGVITRSTTGTGVWTAVTPGDTSISWTNISWSSSKFLCTSNTSASTLTSTTSAAGSWTRTASAYTGFILCNTYLGGKFVALGNGFIQSSTDGFQWTNANNVSYATNTCSRVYLLNGKYFACTDRGLYISTDGTSWPKPPTNTPAASATAVAYGNSIYMAAFAPTVGYPEAIYTSSDAATWTKVADIGTVASATALTAMTDLIFANGNFIITRSSITTAQNVFSYIYTSTNGVTWTPRYLPGSTTTLTNYTSASDGTTAVISQSNGSLKSTDGGITWTPISSTAAAAGWMYSNSIWITSVSNVGILTTTDLASYNNGSIGSISSISGAYVNGNYISSIAINATGSVGKVYMNKNLIAFQPIATTFGVTLSTGLRPYTIRGTTALIPITSSNALHPSAIMEIPLYSYNTSTTFWVPPFGTYICAAT